MRKLIFVIFVVLLMPFTARAFTVPEEVQVTVPPNSYVEVAPLPSGSDVAPFKSATTAPANDKAYKAVKSLDRKLVGKKGMVTMIKEKVQNLYSEITATKTAAVDAQTEAKAAMNSANQAKNAVTALDAKLTDEKVGEFAKMKSTAWSVGAELSKDITKMALLVIGVCLVLAIVIIVILIRRTRRADVNLNPLEQRVETANRGIEEVLDEVRAGFAEMRTDHAELPQRTADAVKAFDPRPIEVTAAGHHAVFTQSAEATAASVYQYFEIDEDVDPSITADAYELLTTSNRDKAYDKIRQIVREYYNGSLQRKAAAGSNTAKLKIALVDHYRDATGQLVVTAV